MVKASHNSSSFSLRTRLLLWLLGPLLLIGILALWDANRAARQTADEISDRLLAGSALAIAEQLFVNDDGELEVDVPYVALQMLTSSADDRVFYRIETLDGDFVTGYRQLDLRPSGKGNGEDTRFFNSTFRGLDIRVATFVGAASSSKKSLGYRVGVAETTNARVATAESILLRSALRQAVLIIAAVILVWVAVTSALKPLSNLKRAIDRRNPDDMRPIRHKVPLEVEGVVERINDLLARFSSSIEALRNFTSNASHQFRTPLALINTHLELAERAKNRADKSASIQNAKNAVGDAERLMGQMLLLSRLDTLSRDELGKKKCDLSAVTRDVCEEFILRLSNQSDLNVDLGFRGDPKVQIRADGTLIQEVVRNLIDNSIKHSGKNPKIDVSVTLVDDAGVLSIVDHGTGFEFDRMLNRDKPRYEYGPPITGNNAGIGLKIVRDIVELLDGSLEASRTTNPPKMRIDVVFAR